MTRQELLAHLNSVLDEFARKATFGKIEIRMVAGIPSLVETSTQMKVNEVARPEFRGGNR